MYFRKYVSLRPLVFGFCRRSRSLAALRLLLTAGLLLIFGPQMAHAAFKPTLNVLTTMHTLSPAMLAQFQSENNANVRVDFVGNRSAFEMYLKSGLRVYDIIIADERTLENLYLARLLRSLPEYLIPPKGSLTGALYACSKINEDGSHYLPLYVDPLGIAYRVSQSSLRTPVSWDVLLHADVNPFWRQRVVASLNPKSQLLLALLATNQDVSPAGWFLPEATTRWLQQLRRQLAHLSGLPLEFAFLGDQVAAAVVFYSDFLRLNRVVPGLDFVVPQPATYYDRMGIAWSVNSVQETLAKSFLSFLYRKRNVLASEVGMVPLQAKSFRESPTGLWVLYEENRPLSKKIDSILKDLIASPPTSLAD